MKPLETIGITIVIVAAGILVYDTVRASEPVVVADPVVRAAPSGDPKLGNTFAERMERRLALMEEQVEAQGRELAVLLGETPDVAPAANEPRPGGLAVAPQPPPMRYDEETLAALKAHLVEMRRRDQEQQVRTQVAGQLSRLGLDLDETQTKQIVDAAVRYRADSSNRWREMQQEGMSDATEMRKQIRPVRDAFVEAVRPVIAPADLDRVVKGLIGGA